MKDLWGREVSLDEARALARKKPPTSRTAKIAARIAAGVHPHMGLAIRQPAGETCGSCKHCRKTPETAGTYWKCDLGALTRGPGTDIRVRWPACVKWEARP